MKIHRRVKALFTLLFLFLCAGALFADRIKSEEFLTLIGVKPQSALYSQLISIYVQYNPNMAIPLNDTEQSTEVSRIIDEAITGVDYFSRVVQGFALIYDEKQIAPYESWARTATGKRIVKMEMDSSSVQEAIMAMAYGAELQNNPPSQKRIDLIRRIADVTGSTDQAARLIYSIARGIHTGLQDSSTEKILLIPPGKSLLPALLDEAMMTAFLFAYRDATDKELVSPTSRCWKTRIPVGSYSP